MARMRRLRAALSPTDTASRFRSLGVDVYFGDARFVGPDTVAVGGQQLRFSRAVVATGSRAATLPVPGLAAAGFLTNETIFSLTDLPRRLLVVGAGPIGCELAQAFRRLGSEVAIVSLDPRLLPREDPDAAAILTARFEREQIALNLGARLVRVEAGPEGKVIVFDRGRGEERAGGDAILLAVGRVPAGGATASPPSRCPSRRSPAPCSRVGRRGSRASISSAAADASLAPRWSPATPARRSARSSSP